MMPLLAPDRLPVHETGAAAHAARTGRLSSLLLRGRGARVLLSAACLMPLAACAAQPAAPGATDSAEATRTAPAASREAAPAPQPAPAARQQQQQQQQQQATAPAAQPPAASAATPATTPERTVAAPRAVPPAAATQAAATQAATTQAATTQAADRPAAVAPQESATTVGEVPTTARNPVDDPPATVVPGAPAAIPGTPANPVTIPQPAPGPSTGTLLQTIFALVLVLALLAALAWLAKRYGPKMAGGGGHLRMVGALNIGGRERIMVVEVGDQWIVVGASPGRINALATMPKQEAGVQSTATLAGSAPPAASFSDWLKQTIDKRNAK